MKLRRWVSIIGPVGLLGLAGVAFAQAQAPAAEMNKGLAPEVQQKMDLTDAQVKGFFDAADELRAAGKVANSGTNTANPATFAKVLAAGDESAAIIQKHGFKDATEFQRVGYNAALAYNVLQQGGKQVLQEKIARTEVRQKEMLERLRPKLTEEQIKLLEKQAGMATNTARTMQDVPDGNIEIMKQYSDRMKNLGKVTPSKKE